MDITRHYEDCARRGVTYGPAFRGLVRAWRYGDDLLAEAILPEDVASEPSAPFHPAQLDAALQALLFDTGMDAPPLPFSWHEVGLHGPAGGTLRVHIRPTDAEGSNKSAQKATTDRQVETAPV